MRFLIILFLIIFLPKNVGASTLEQDCATSLQSLFSDEISKDEAGEFLQLQADITLHRLAWAYLRSQKQDKDEKIQSIERTIIELLNDKYTHSDPDFIKARDAYEAQPLSRTALADIAPYLQEVISEKYDDKDSNFILNNSDVKLLAAIAKQERSTSENGIYAHKMFISNSANGMLNFVKLINSGYKINSNEDEKNLQIEMRLTGLENVMIAMKSKLDDFLDKIHLPSSCLQEEDCSTDVTLSDFFKLNNDVQNIFWESLSDKLLSDDLLLQKLSYGDLWLKTGGVKQAKQQHRHQNPVVRGLPQKRLTKKIPSPIPLKNAGLIIEDPLRIIVNDKAGRKADSWKSFGNDFQKAMAAAIIADEKVFFYNGNLHDRATGRFISIEEAQNKLLDSQKIILRRALTRVDEKLKMPLVQAWVNGRDTFVFNDKLYNPYGQEIDPVKVITTIMKNKLDIVISSESTKKLGNNYLILRANALRNNQSYFKLGHHTLDSYSGRDISSPFRPLNVVDVKLDKSRRRVYEKLSDTELIRNFNREKIDKICNYYGVLDKKQAILKIYDSPGNEIYSSEILVGAETSDQRTRWTEYSGSKRVSNSSTGAGIFSVRPQNVNDSFNKKHFNNNILSFKNETQDDAVFAIHQVPVGLESRNTRFGTNNPQDRRVSGGCANLMLSDFNAVKKWLGNTCKLYVLPEEQGNKFVVKDNQLKLVSTQNVDVKLQKFYNYSLNDYRPAKIKMKIVNPAGDTQVARDFIKALEDEKQKLMRLYKLSNDEYNDLALLAYGILGNESEFGNSNRLSFKENNQFVVVAAKLIKAKLKGRNLAEAFNTSRGYTQIKDLPGENFYKTYPEINKSNLSSPRNSAIATMGYLVEAAKMMKSIAHENKDDPSKVRITKENMIDFIGYIYQGKSNALKTSDLSKQAAPGSNGYFRSLKKNMSYIEVTQKFE